MNTNLNSKKISENVDLTESILEKIIKLYSPVVERPWAKFPENITVKEKYSGKWFALFMKIDGRKIGLSKGSLVPIVNVKADPDFIALMSHTDGYAPAYHMNKENWISVRLDGSVDLDQILSVIDRSFSMVSDSPTRRIYEAVKSIPRGKVATYGQIAVLAGNPRMSRAVGNALHKNPDPDHIPCYRVVNSRGELAPGFAFGGIEVQKKLLEADGIEVIDGRVDLTKYGISSEKIK
ncbi:MAG: methylated-DNA--[protein]-cysteine S-methyltransferase [Candidatus Weimeria sp.]